MVKVTGCGAGPSRISSDLELLAGLRLQLDFLEAGGDLRERGLRGECGESGQRNERGGPSRRCALAAFAVVDRVQRCSGHARVSLQIVAQRKCSGTLDEAAHAVRNDLDERDLAFLDGRDPAIALAEMVAGQHPVDQPVLRLYQPVIAATQPQRADHAERVERELLEELARPD